MQKPSTGATTRLPQPENTGLAVRYESPEHRLQVIYTAPKRAPRQHGGLWLLIGAMVALAAFGQGAALGVCVLLALVAVAMIAGRED